MQDLAFIYKEQSKAEKKKNIKFAFCIDTEKYPEEASLWKAVGFKGLVESFRKIIKEKEDAMLCE